MTDERDERAAPLGVGIIGMGSIGFTHARALRDVNQARLVACSGGDEGRAAEAGWPDARRMRPLEVVADPAVDVVGVCAPTPAHAELTMAAVEAGKHVLVEKPLTVSLADAEAIAARAAERGVIVAMVAQRRLEPEHVALKRLIDDGALGALRLAAAQVHWLRDDSYYAAAEWRRSQLAGGGSLLNQGVHSVDLLRWLCGEVADVTAQSGTIGHDHDAEDTTVATLRFRSGALGVLSTSTATPPGTPATIALHFSTGVVELGQGEVIRWDVPAPAPTSSSAASGAADPAAIGELGHRRQWEDFLRAVRDRGRPLVDADDAVRTVRLLDAISRSAQTCRTVSIGEDS